MRMELMKKFLGVAFGLALLTSVSADAADRNVSLITAFKDICTIEPPTFAKISQKAAAMKLVVHQELGQSKSGGQFSHNKSWFIPDTAGQYELIAMEANGAKNHVENCGISATDPDGELFKKTLISAMSLTASTSEIITSDGEMRVTSWKDEFGEGTSLIMVDGTPKGHAGVMLYYQVLTPGMP